jgi:hypothetical protein
MDASGRSDFNSIGINAGCDSNSIGAPGRCDFNSMVLILYEPTKVEMNHWAGVAA